MKERGVKPQGEGKTPGEMLSEARDGLAQCRELFILSTVMLMSSSTTKAESVFWKKIWFNASLEEERITRKLVVPAKLKTEVPRTVPAVEDRVRAAASEFIRQIFGLEPKPASDLAKAIVDPHIECTKIIQKEGGVPERAAHTRRINSGRKHTIFSRKPAPKRVAC